MISSLMDTWVLTSLAEQSSGAARRWFYVLKSRGMAHSDGHPRVPLHRSRHRHLRRRRRSERDRPTRSSTCGSTSPARPPRPIRAFTNLQKICDEHLAGRYHIEVIDLLEDPQLGRATRSWRFRRWCADCRRRSRRSSATCPTPNAYWSGSICAQKERVWLSDRNRPIVTRWKQAANKAGPNGICCRFTSSA